MTVRADSFPFPSTLVRRLLTPALPWAVAAAFVVIIRERMLRPRLPRMSAEWLQNFDRQHRGDE
jgi:hypothetical protein